MKRRQKVTGATPCPFCGKTHLFIQDSEDGEKDFEPMAYWVECKLCGTEGPYAETPQGALDAWEKRLFKPKDGAE